MRNNPFESQLERLARTLTDQFGVRVTCQGEEAWTDGTQIVLPSLPEPMEQGLERMVVGFLDHEMAHVAFSRFEEIAQFAKKHRGYEGMLNVVEDALVERRAMERWPGVRGNLDAMFRQIRGRIALTVSQRDAFGKFCTAVYLKLSHHKDMLGLEPLVDGYDDLLDWFPAISDTRGAAELAEQILERWLKQNPPHAQPAASNAGDGNSGDGNAGDDESTANGEGEDQPESTSSGRVGDEGTSEHQNRANSGGQGADAPSKEDNAHDANCGQHTGNGQCSALVIWNSKKLKSHNTGQIVFHLFRFDKIPDGFEQIEVVDGKRQFQDARTAGFQ